MTDHSAAPSLQIRAIESGDAASVAELSGQLGYPTAIEEIRGRIATFCSLPDAQQAFVACLDTAIVGWIEVTAMHHLQSPPFAMIGGLVVKEGFRGMRIGKRLCEEAERWAKTHNISLLRVTSRSSRTDAHRFYLREGYTQTKTSLVFEKILPRPDPGVGDS